MSWYRTYRPQTIGGLHIPSVRAALERIRTSGSFSHAYLFCGPKGTGKTSSARILAKMLNCEQNANAVEQFLTTGKAAKHGFVEPCGVCSFCKGITSGISMNVTEMDAASNRGIDDIRALRERLNLAPTDGAVSVYIIDEVHMLTTEAFNALLKVLEEPPRHVVFALATTELHKVPETVISRCTMVLYKKAAVEDIVAALSGALKQEGITADAAVVEAIAQQADGSFRDAIKALESIATGKKSLTMEDLAQGQRSSSGEADALLQAVEDKDVQAVAAVFVQLGSRDGDVLYIQKQVLALIHEKMVHAVDTKDAVTAGRYAALLSALNTPIDPLIPVPHLPFELACMTWCLGDAVQQSKPAHVVQKISVPEKMRVSEKVASEPESKKASAVEETEVPPTHVGTALVDLDALTARWSELLKEIRVSNASVEALLRAARPSRCEGNTVVIEVYYAFHKEQLEQEKHRHLLESMIMKMFDAAQIKLSFILGKKVVVAKPVPTQAEIKKDAELEQDAAEAFM